MKTVLTILYLTTFSFVLFAQENGGPYTPDENTVLLMHFDGDATNSANIGNNGIEHGSGVSFESGVHGNCVRLDNSTSDKQSWIEVPFYDELNLTEEFSIEFWFKPSSKKDGNRQALLWKEGKEGTQQYSALVNSELNSLEAFLDCDTLNDWDWSLNASTRLLDFEVDKWYHISFYYRYEGRHLLLLLRDENYKELYFAYAGSEAPPVTSDGKLSIGNGGGWSCFDGCIDELRISNKKRNYRDDVFQDVDISSFKEEVFLQLKDSWGSYQWPLGELFPINKVTGEIFRKNHCGPTAVSRAIHYWEFPRFPSGLLQHTMSDCDWYIDFDNTEYLWDLMPDNFPSDVTVEEYTPAATFAMHIGASSRESYDYMPCYPEFLINHFHFSPKTRILHREDYTKEEWINILKNELNNGRPVVAGGVIKETITGQGAAGHYYLIDGYNKNNEFHTDYSMADNVWDDPDNFDYGYGMSIIAFMEPDWKNKTLGIISPTENSHLKTGSETEIKWTSSNVNQVKIEYSDNAGKTWQIIEDNVDAVTGKINWTIPDSITSEYKIRISDTEDLNVYRKTGLFEVYEVKNLVFEYPKQNTTLKKGTTQPIYWQSSGLSTLTLEYSIGNSSWNMLCDSVPGNSGFFLAELPDIETNQVMLRAVDTDEPENVFYSENFKLISDQLWGGPYEIDDETLLLMHFENKIKNEVQNQLMPIELNPIGIYEENYAKNLGKAFRIFNYHEIVGDAFRVKNSENIDLGNNWTMEAWVKVTSIGGERNVASIIFNKWDVFGIGAGGQYFEGFVNFENGTNVEFRNPQKYTLNQWYHVAMISDAPQEIIGFYVHDENAQLVYQEVKPFPEGSVGMVLKKEFINDGNDKNLLTIGGLGGASNFELDGYLDEVRITKSSKLMDYIETVELPFFDDFEEEYKYWQTYNKTGFDWWHISGDDGTDGSKCARFSTSMETPYEVNDDWLLTKRFNTTEFSKINISFKYWYYGDGIVPEIVYSPNYVSNIEQAEWIQLDNSNWGEAWTWNTAAFEIENPGENITLAIRYQSDEGHASYLLIDDFSIEGTITNSKKITKPEIDFKIYPNPVTGESVISFQTKTSGNVNLSVFDMQGRKICTLLDEKQNAGQHTISVISKQLVSGIYFCKLQTSDGISTKKLIVNSK